MTTNHHIPSERRERFDEVAGLIEQFGQQHLDAELTGFAIELWKRVCRRKAPDCLFGKPSVWAASVTHVIARMNFLFDRSQPVHLTFGAICDFFQTSKNTVGGKATEIERTLRLGQHMNRDFAGRSCWKPLRTSACPTGWFSLGKWPSRWAICQPARGLKICSKNSGTLKTSPPDGD